MDFNQAFGLDEEKELKGVWFPLGPDARVLIARTGNPKFREMARKELNMYSGNISLALLGDEGQNDVMIKIMAHTICLGWEGMTDEGNDYPYSIKNAIAQMKKHRLFRDFVAEKADNLEAFKIEQVVQDQGNLPTVSVGTEATPLKTKNGS